MTKAGQAVSQPQQGKPQKRNEKLTGDAFEKMRRWLDSTERPFSVATAPLSRKRKRDSAGWTVQDGLFEDRLSVQFEVRPRDKWESLNKYSRLTVVGQGISVGQCILVKHDDIYSEVANVADQWKAKILEVRALDGEHVYVRVVWLNRPEDLVHGRKPYHGLDELIPTNQMDIIDAMTINGAFEVVHYKDIDADSAVIRDSYFWRQTFDYVNTRTFSKLRQICIDSQPVNPDELIIQCSNQACRKWLHVKCIAEAAVRRTAGSSGKPPKKKAPAKKIKTERHNSPPADSVIAKIEVSANKIDVEVPQIDVKTHKLERGDSNSVARAQLGEFVSEVYIKGLPEENGLFSAEAASETKIVVTNANGKEEVTPVACLFCNEAIED